MKTEIEVVKYLGVDLIVNFTVDGKHIFATREQPEEFPDYEIHKVFVENTDVMPMLLESQIDDIYNLLIEKIEV